MMVSAVVPLLWWPRLSLASLWIAADGTKRFPKGESGDDKSCGCSDGWDGLNCNVCKTDAACSNFLLGGERDSARTVHATMEAQLSSKASKSAMSP